MENYGNCHICGKSLYDDEYVTRIIIYQRAPMIPLTPLMEFSYCEYCSETFLLAANILFTSPDEV